MKDLSIFCHTCNRSILPSEHEGVKKIYTKFLEITGTKNTDLNNSKPQIEISPTPIPVTVVKTIQPSVQLPIQKKQIKQEIKPQKSPNTATINKKIEDDVKMEEDIQIYSDSKIQFDPKLQNLAMNNRKLGKCGLYNQGNTCYMNASLQCLYSIVPFRRCMQEMFFPSRCSFSLELINLFNEMDKSR